jgi:hypothetical protein
MTSRQFVTVAVALFASVAACTGGSGTSSLPFPAPRDTPPNLRDLFDDGREDPGESRENPGNDRQTPGGAQGPGDAVCPACDESYACIITSGGSSSILELTFETTGAGCTIRNQKATFRCDGTIVPDGEGLSITWHPYGVGGFAAATKGSTITCVPDPSHQGGDDTSNSGSSSNGGDTPSNPGTGSSGGK